MDKTYWALLTGSELGQKLQDKIETYYKHINQSGLLYTWKKIYTELNTVVTDGANIKNRGKNGEYKKIKINNLRSFKTNLSSLVTEVRPKFTVQATNTDFQSQMQTKLARGLLDYYLSEKRLEIILKDVISNGLDYGRGWISLEWSPTIGNIISVNDDGRPIYDGDLKFNAHNELDIIRPIYKQADGEPWVIIRKKVNKYDLMASFPEFADDIAGMSYDYNDFERNIYINHSISQAEEDDETVALYEFRHKKCESLPEGRLVLFLDADTILVDTPLPYDNLAVFSFDTAPLSDITFGYSPLFDLLPIFDAYNKLTSTILSNQANLGHSNVGIPQGSNYDYKQLAEGFNVIEYNAQSGQIIPINLLQTPGEIFNFVNSLEQMATKISGINPVRRGDPGSLGANSSGSAYALFVAQSISFNINLSHSYNMLLEQVGTCLVSILKSFATVPRIANIAGVNNAYYVKEFSGDDLKLVQRVKVAIGNPISDTLSGKLSIAQDLMQKGALTPQEYIQVLNTGNLETVLDLEESTDILIQQENEGMLNGVPAIALVTDNHLLHKQGHLTLLNNAETRQNPALVQLILDHIAEHDNLMMQLSQAQGNLAMFNQMSMQQSPPPANQGGGQPQIPVDGQRPPSMADTQPANQPKIAGTNQRIEPPFPVTGTESGNIK
ncbi:ATP-binding protein [Leptospira levettii]|uniref:ATP-binding protein n=1 Tax=Leptospira levettii TaxID=2023178 RepID=UPI00108390EA|nr:ATP-binding protein [Leptospira levettii]TGM95036.1 ATP-binding protein [Leptospira levettii]